jgi:hypothetical protein
MHVFLTSTVEIGEWSASRPGCFGGKSPWYRFDRRLGGPRSRSGLGGEEKNSPPLPRIEHWSSIQQLSYRSRAGKVKGKGKVVPVLN